MSTFFLSKESTPVFALHNREVEAPSRRFVPCPFAAWNHNLTIPFEDRELSFARAAAEATATIAAETRVRGIKLGTADMQIAGIATANGFAVASRDALPFKEAGVTLINPWEDGK